MAKKKQSKNDDRFTADRVVEGAVELAMAEGSEDSPTSDSKAPPPG